MSRRVIPLRGRPWDVALVAFFVVNLLFTTYVVSLEQVVIDDIHRFAPPLCSWRLTNCGPRPHGSHGT